MTIKEVFDSHLKKSSAHHDALAKCNRAMAKAHKDAADSHKDQVVAQAHRDISEQHGNLAKAHQKRQADFEALRENLAAASDATVLDSHADASDELRTASTYGDLLKSMRLLPAD